MVAPSLGLIVLHVQAPRDSRSTSHNGGSAFSVRQDAWRRGAACCAQKMGTLCTRQTFWSDPLIRGPLKVSSIV
jgi:hypothetical protein